MGVPAELGRLVTTRKGVTVFPRLCSREGKAEDIFGLFMSISKWNHMHIGSVPWNNESIIVHYMIVGWKLDADLTWVVFCTS